MLYTFPERDMLVRAFGRYPMDVMFAATSTRIVFLEVVVPLASAVLLFDIAPPQ